MPAGIAYALVDYLADIGPVGQQLIEMATGEGSTSTDAAACAGWSPRSAE